MISGIGTNVTLELGLLGPDQTSKRLATSSKSFAASTALAAVNNLADSVSPSIASSGPTVQKAIWTPTGQLGVYIASGGRQVIKLDEALTATDKSLIKNLNGGNLDGGSMSVEELKGDIALSRVYGMLDGDVTPSYIGGLMAEQQQAAQMNQQNAAQAEERGDNTAAQAYAAYDTPSISMSILEKALEIVT